MYDLAGGSWHVNPSGCTYPGAGSFSTAAVAVDDYTIMVLGATDAGTSARNDLLDLRTWRWRSGSGLTNDMTNSIGLTMFEGQAVAVGGQQGDVFLLTTSGSPLQRVGCVRMMCSGTLGQS
jgi:hypothetical protein